MRWRTRYTRIVKRFALFPITESLNLNTRDEEHRWLEIVYLHQARDWLLGIIPCWITVCFATKEEYDAYISKKKKEKER